MSDSSPRPRFIAGLAVLAALALGMWLGGHPDSLPEPLRDVFVHESAELTAETIDLVEDNYFRQVDSGELDAESVRGLLRILRKRYGDRFSHYFDEEEFERFEEVTGGEFSGVGLTVTEVPRGLRVADVIEGSPADEAGIEVGEVVTAVDGRAIAGESAGLATSLIKGEAGTEVTLMISAAGGGKARKLTLRRARLRIPLVEKRLIRVGGEPVGYVHLLAFSAGAHAELRQEIQRLDDRGAEGLILDLRGNGGGLLTEAILTSSVFIEEGLIVSTRARTEGRRGYEAVGEALDERPMVVLINADTASAAEILAAALSEKGLATLVGEQTFGKGTFQQVIPLDDGGALDLTVGEYLTSSGRSLADEGITPGVRARDLPRTSADEGLSRARRVLADELAGD